MFDFNDKRYTHMPFAAHGAEGKPEQFCCIRNNDALWKLYHYTGQKWKRVKTGLPEDATECGPTAEWEEGIWKISFVAGGWKGDRRFRLYRMYGIGGEVSVQNFADVGFVWKDRVCYAGRQGPIYLVEPEKTTVLRLHGVDYLYRISYNPNCPNELLISGQYADGSVFSWAYRPEIKVLKNISADGNPAYKCAFFNGECFYAKREKGFEERRIVKAQALEVTELPAKEFITETHETTHARPGNPEFE